MNLKQLLFYYIGVNSIAITNNSYNTMVCVASPAPKANLGKPMDMSEYEDRQIAQILGVSYNHPLLQRITKRDTKFANSHIYTLQLKDGGSMHIETRYGIVYESQEASRHWYDLTAEEKSNYCCSTHNYLAIRYSAKVFTVGSDTVYKTFAQACGVPPCGKRLLQFQPNIEKWKCVTIREWKNSPKSFIHTTGLKVVIIPPHDLVTCAPMRSYNLPERDQESI